MLQYSKNLRFCKQIHSFILYNSRFITNNERLSDILSPYRQSTSDWIFTTTAHFLKQQSHTKEQTIIFIAPPVESTVQDYSHQLNM